VSELHAKFQKILRAVSEISEGRMDGTDSIGPLGLRPGTNNAHIIEGYSQVLHVYTNSMSLAIYFSQCPKTSF